MFSSGRMINKRESGGYLRFMILSLMLLVALKLGLGSKASIPEFLFCTEMSFKYCAV